MLPANSRDPTRGWKRSSHVDESIGSKRRILNNAEASCSHDARTHARMHVHAAANVPPRAGQKPFSSLKSDIDFSLDARSIPR